MTNLWLLIFDFFGWNLLLPQQKRKLTVGQFLAGAQNILVIQKFLPDIRNCENTATRKKWCVSSVVEYIWNDKKTVFNVRGDRSVREKCYVSGMLSTIYFGLPISYVKFRHDLSQNTVSKKKNDKDTFAKYIQQRIRLIISQT